MKTHTWKCCGGLVLDITFITVGTPPSSLVAYMLHITSSMTRIIGLLLGYLDFRLLGLTQASPAVTYIITTLLIRVDLWALGFMVTNWRPVRSTIHADSTYWCSSGYFILFISPYNRLKCRRDGGEEKKASEMSRSLFKCDFICSPMGCAFRCKSAWISHSASD